VTESTVLAPLVVPGDTGSVLDRWRQVVQALPDRPALASAGTALTFAEADRASDVLAARLLVVLPDDGSPVATLLDLSARGIVGLLAVVKTGRVLVTLDAHLPIERLRQIASLAGASTCLVDAEHRAVAQQLQDVLRETVRIEDVLDQPTVDAAAARLGDTELPTVRRDLSDPLCIVFTSGSTGVPKGVVYTHGQTLNDAYSGRRSFRIIPDDRVALVLPLSFAAGYALLMMAILNGAGVWCYDPRDQGVRRLEPWITQARLTTLHCTPHLLRSLVGVLPTGMVVEPLRLVSTVGEAVHGRDYEAARAHLTSAASLVNWTGSSEIGCLSFHEIAPGQPIPTGPVPAGAVVPNKQVVIRRDDGKLADDGEVGQLTVVSDYLSGGYWNNPEADAARFTVDDGLRVCRQGDLASLKDGMLNLHGRGDAAVKIRGYLVEPSEVEAAILDSDAVREAAVVAVTRPSTPTYLAAYVAPDPERRTESVAALRRRLRTRLPEYMVPSVIVQVAALPRNERGKVDRRLLPPPALTGGSEPPRTSWEVTVAELWAEVLGLEFVGAADDFMALGGDSLTAEEMLATVADRCSVALVTSDLVEAPTVREFAKRVALGSASLPSHPDVVPLRVRGEHPPLFCFAGAGALALSFLPLSRHLPDRPVYAFQAHGLEQRALPDRTVEASARRALEIMRIVQPRGPYSLVGHSFGGLVAVEIARQLVAAGEEVRLLGLLDTYLPRSSDAVPADLLPSVARSGPRTPWSRLRTAAGARVHRVWPDGIPGPDQWSRHARARLAGVVPFDGQRQFDAFFDHAIKVANRYRIPRYDGPAVVVLAANNPDGTDAWRRFVTRPHETVEIRAEHSSLLRAPYAVEVADVLRRHLEASDS
jgi:acyl-coenzyme A synthetase/AMP-(fatty) acid ligase/thioesterase domain-containing protein